MFALFQILALAVASLQPAIPYFIATILVALVLAHHFLRGHSPARGMAVIAAVVAILVAVGAYPASAATAANDLGAITGVANMSIFSQIYGFLQGPGGMVMAGILVFAAVQRIKSGFETHEAIHTTTIALLGVAMLAGVGTIWAHFGGSAAGAIL